MKYNNYKVFLLIIFIVPYTFSQNGWDRQSVLSGCTVTEIHFINGDTGWLSTSGSINGNILSRGAFFRTTNGGNNWINIIPDQNNVQFTSFMFVTPLIGWMTGNAFSQSGNYRRIYKTVNGGLNWILNREDLTQQGFNKMYFINENTGWITTAGSQVYHTVNGGVNWTITGITTSSYLNSIYFYNEQEGWCTGGYVGKLYHTVDGGNSWETIINTGQNTPLWDIHFLDYFHGYVTGSYGRNFKTTNGGVNWVFNYIDTINAFTGVQFLNANTGYIVSGKYPDPNGRIFKTTNGGTNWVMQYSTGFTNMSAIYFINENTGWVGGIKEDLSLVLKTTTGGAIGIINIGMETPERFSLSQNYPNPFNPATNIKFDVPESGFIRLVIFDVLGKEVKTLVNEQLSTGTYNADFDAGSLPSGVYYYRLESGGFTETKKMVLVK